MLFIQIREKLVIFSDLYIDTPMCNNPCSVSPTRQLEGLELPGRGLRAGISVFLTSRISSEV